MLRGKAGEDELRAGWGPAVPRADAPVSDREVARFRWNDGRPFAEVELPDAPLPPAITGPEREALEVEFERWVRQQWHVLLRESGIHYDRGALPADEPSPPYRTP